MADKIIDIIRFFFKENFSQKRLFVILISILFMVFSFFVCHKQGWFGNLKEDYGNLAVVTFLSICFSVPFLISELICNKVFSNKQEYETKKKKAETIFDTFNRLTDWQRSFLLHNILQKGQSQIKSYEIGGCKAVWGCEMEALIAKRIVTEISYENYEINPAYYDYIKKYYDPESQKLRLPDICEINK